MLENGLSQSKDVPQLFYKKEGVNLVLIVANIVDDQKVAGERDLAAQFLKSFHNRFKLVKINHGPGKLRFYGINTVQNDECTVSTDADGREG